MCRLCLVFLNAVLCIMLQTYPNCPQGLVLYSGPYRELPEQNLVFMPIYCAATIGDTDEARLGRK